MGNFSRSGRAVLVFARSLRRDLLRRGWPQWMGPVLRLPFQDAPFEDADVHIFTSVAEGAACDQSRVFRHAQSTGTFGARLGAAIESLADLGYREVAVVGRDCPELAPRDVEEAFSALASHRLALGPDHKGGLYLIAFRITDRHLLDGIRWRRDTDCRQLRESVAPDEVHLLEVKHDLDDIRDLLLLARRGSLRSAAALRLLDLLRSWASRRTPDPFRQLESEARISWQLPPPIRPAAKS